MTVIYYGEYLFDGCTCTFIESTGSEGMNRANYVPVIFFLLTFAADDVSVVPVISRMILAGIICTQILFFFYQMGRRYRVYFTGFF